MSTRFTIDGSGALEEHLENVCKEVRRGVCSIVPGGRLEGLVLAGGYGRGEGGVLRCGSMDAPYNDLEFFVFIRGSTLINDSRYRRLLQELGEDLSTMAGIEVEFKILSCAKLRNSAPSMFYYDLIMGHRCLVSEDEVLFAGCDHHRDASQIPLHEAARLLFNRCSGLLYAKERLQRTEFTDDDADFVGRNIAKAKLALGDVWLTMHGNYHWSCTERLRRLKTMTDGCAHNLAPHHQTGVEFKLHPQRNQAADKSKLLADHSKISALAESLWLQLESRRIRHPFRSMREYAAATASLCPERSAFWNGLCNLRAFGMRGLGSRFFTRYPRERLLRALSLLLWGKTNAEDAAIVSACLLCDDREFGLAVRAYERLWHRFN